MNPISMVTTRGTSWRGKSGMFSNEFRLPPGTLGLGFGFRTFRPARLTPRQVLAP